MFQKRSKKDSMKLVFLTPVPSAASLMKEAALSTLKSLNQIWSIGNFLGPVIGFIAVYPFSQETNLRNSLPPPVVTDTFASLRVL